MQTKKAPNVSLSRAHDGLVSAMNKYACSLLSTPASLRASLYETGQFIALVELSFMRRSNPYKKGGESLPLARTTLLATPSSGRSVATPAMP